MKNRVLKVIRFMSLLLVILLFLPTFSLWAVEAPEGEGVSTAAEVQAQNEVSRVIWTEHKLTGNPSSSAKQSKKTTVITLKKNYNESTKEYEMEFNAIVVNYTNIQTQCGMNWGICFL